MVEKEEGFAQVLTNHNPVRYDSREVMDMQDLEFMDVALELAKEAVAARSAAPAKSASDFKLVGHKNGKFGK